jgi:cytidyltransferase-like protein
MYNTEYNHLIASIPYGYFHGRFQPFHLGHLHLIKTALQEVNELIIGISNPFRQPAKSEKYIKLDKKASISLSDARNPGNNPWPMWARCLMIREGLRSEDVDLSRIIFMPNLLNTGISEFETVLPKEMVQIYLFGKDDHNKRREEEYIKDGYKLKSVPPVDSAVVSATEVRERIRKNGDWESLVPIGTAQVIKFFIKQGYNFI